MPFDACLTLFVHTLQAFPLKMEAGAKTQHPDHITRDIEIAMSGMVYVYVLIILAPTWFHPKRIGQEILLGQRLPTRWCIPHVAPLMIQIYCSDVRHE